MRFYQLWHERTHAAPEVTWLRRRVADVAMDLDVTGKASAALRPV